MDEFTKEDQEHLEKYFKRLYRKIHRKRLKLAKDRSTLFNRVDPNDIEFEIGEVVDEPDGGGRFYITFKYPGEVDDY